MDFLGLLRDFDRWLEAPSTSTALTILAGNEREFYDLVFDEIEARGLDIYEELFALVVSSHRFVVIVERRLERGTHAPLPPQVVLLKPCPS